MEEQSNDISADRIKEFYCDHVWSWIRETPMKLSGVDYVDSRFIDGNGYRKDSIRQMYIPEYTVELSGEKLFELLKWFYIRFDNWIKPYHNHDIMRSKNTFNTFIRYNLDSTWYRRIKTLIESVHDETTSKKFIMGLWVRDQLRILDSELAVTLIKMFPKWSDGKIRDSMLREIVRLACAFNLDLDNCLQTAYGIDSSHVHEINKYIMNYRLDSKIRPDWWDESVKRHGDKVKFGDGKKCVIYDMKHQILLF